MAKRKEATECPVCGKIALREHRGDFAFEPPRNIPGGTIVIAGATWEECSACNERIIRDELDRVLDEQARRRQGLLTPREIKGIRKRSGLSQTEIAQILSVGAKTYTRWETGKSIQNKSNDNLIRLIAQDPGVLARLEAQRQPDRRRILLRYFESLADCKGKNKYAVAAHGIELGSSECKSIQRRLRRLLRARNEG